MRRKAPTIIAVILGIICILLFVMLLSDRLERGQAETLTLSDVVGLSGRGLSLSWSDFEEFEHESVGTSQHTIWEFPIAEPGYRLFIDGSGTNTPPANILLTRETGDSVEIRTGDVLAFLAEGDANLPAPPPTPPAAPNPPTPPAAPNPPPTQPPAPPTPPATPAPPGPEPIATFSVTASPSSYDVSAAQISIVITNTSQVEGTFGLSYRIERSVNGRWEIVPLNFNIPDIAMILAAGQSITENFSLHQNQFSYQPGTYRIVFLDGLGGASAQFTLTGVVPTPTYSVSVHPQGIPVTSEYITVSITNTSQVEGGYGYGHRIQRHVNGRWENVPLNMSPVISIWAILPAGQTATYDLSLYQDQFFYEPGRYRVILTGVDGQPSAEFTLF